MHSQHDAASGGDGYNFIWLIICNNNNKNLSRKKWCDEFQSDIIEV